MEILHKRGKDNLVIDALSRKDEVQTYAISIVIPEWLDEIQREQAKDPNTCTLIEYPNRGSKFEWRNDILWYKGRIYLNPTSRFKTKVMIESHDSPTVGHVVFSKHITMPQIRFIGKECIRTFKNMQLNATHVKGIKAKIS